MKRKNHQAVADAGHTITMEQLAVLEMLHTNGDMNMTELSHAVWKQNANITRIVDKLEKQALLERRTVAEDRRAYLLCLSAKGRQVYIEIAPILKKTHQDIVSCISSEEAAITLNTLKKIIHHLTES